MLIQKQPPYYIVNPSERGRILAKALTVLVFAGIATGIFLCACMWARSTVRGIEVTTENGAIEHD